MAELKTQKTNASVAAFLATVEDEGKRKDSQELVKIFEELSKEKATMWGASIIGFGQYHYKSERSKQQGDWPLTGFSPRKQNLTIYIMSGFGDQKKLLEKLGKHKVSGGSCLYINHLSDINVDVLKELIKASLKYMKEKYKVK
jgi:hypothetical protein